jgi:hypothetical protein
MPALLPVAQCLRVAAHGTIDAYPFASLFNWKYTGGSTTSVELDTFCNSFGSAWNTHFAGLYPASTRLTGVVAYDMTAPDAPQGQAGFATPGSRVGTMLPAQVACCVTWKVNYRWRGGHPRTYFPFGVTGDLADAAHFNQTFTDPVDTACEAFRAQVNSLLLGSKVGYMALVRRQHTPIKGQPPVNFDPPLVLVINGSEVDTRVDTQRRRLGRDIPA